jgi:hypothetical protein
MPKLEINNSQTPQKSSIKRSGLNNFLSRLFGFQRTGRKSGSGGLEFVKVDVPSDQRVGQSLLNNLVTRTPMSEKLEKLFQNWLSDNTDKITELQERASRISQLQYMVLNDPYVNRTVELYADEATQLDDQDTLLNIETPDPRMTKRMYELVSLWGLTQTRIREIIKQLAIYGDAFWANKVTENGVERIIPLQQLQVIDRVEFNPIKALEMKKRKDGSFAAFASKNFLIDKMITSMEDSEDFADMFDTKLFGFEIDKDVIVPPWCITHFRLGGEASEFWPFGTSPIIGALGPYKQTQSTITLQSLARVMSFPITLYKVKTDENMDEARQFATVNKVRESYDNIGVSPAAGNSEVYTVNTKIWIPDGLLDVDVKKPETSSADGVEDIKVYQEREAVALDLPKSFFGDDGWYNAGKSGKALIQQYKPFARRVFSIQSAFLSGLADTFRIHFAVTGEYDFRIPFTLSVKYPAVENDGEVTNAKKDSMELATSVIDLIKNAVGIGEDENLPLDIIRDILAKYTFLNPSDLFKWTRNLSYVTATNTTSDESESDEEDMGDLDIEDGSGESGDEESEPELELGDLGESKKRESKKFHEKLLLNRYREQKNRLYFEVLKETAVNGFVRGNQHVQVFNNVPNENEPMLDALSEESKAESNRLREGLKEKNHG